MTGDVATDIPPPAPVEHSAFAWPARIEHITSAVELPVVKDVGFSLSATTIRWLRDTGVSVADVSGQGGTNFARIENNRRPRADDEFVDDWGQSTACCLPRARDIAGIEVLASGGIRSPLDAARALALGAAATSTRPTCCSPAMKCMSRLTEQGIVATVIDERMTRSILLVAEDGPTAHNAVLRLTADFEELQTIVATAGRFTRLIRLNHQIAGNLLFLRFEFTTGDAAGHNMTTLAADHLMNHILHVIPGVRYGSISGNYCTDKRPRPSTASSAAARTSSPSCCCPRRPSTSTWWHSTYAKPHRRLTCRRNPIHQRPLTPTCYWLSSSPPDRTPPRTSSKAPRLHPHRESRRRPLLLLHAPQSHHRHVHLKFERRLSSAGKTRQ